MGAEESKQGTGNSSCLWLSADEQKLINQQVTVIGNKSKEITFKQIQTGLVKADDGLSNKIIPLIQFHSPSGNSKTSLTAVVLTNVLCKLINPDPCQQATVTQIFVCNGPEVQISSTSLLKFVGAVVERYCRLAVHPRSNAACERTDNAAAERVAKTWLHELLFPGSSLKQSHGLEAADVDVSLESVEKWLRGQSAVYLSVQCSVLRHLLVPRLPSSPSLMPEIITQKDVGIHLSSSEVLLLNTSLPATLRCQWRLRFCNTSHGDSFSVLMKQIVDAGPTLLVVEDEAGHRWGGFAAAPWQVRPQFHGTAENFLFSLGPEAGIYRTTGYNTNYQYLNYLENNTMPNGLGMGGREELFGIFLSHDFGECRVAPTCSTYQSPAVCPCSAEPRIRRLTVWAVGEEPVESDDSDDEPGKKKRSALDSNPDARAMLDMIGRGRASDGHREPEEDDS